MCSGRLRRQTTMVGFFPCPRDRGHTERRVRRTDRGSARETIEASRREWAWTMSESPAQDSDESLVALARMGDRAAFAELWQRHARSGIRVARQFTSSIEADDLVAEAYTRIYGRVLAGGGPVGAFRPYLYTTIRNLASRWGQANREVQVDDIEDFEDPRAEDDPSTSTLDRTLTADAFRTLPERWQSVLWYTEVEGMDPHEVAPLLGLSANGVAALSYRAREGLRKAWLQAHISDTTAWASAAGRSRAWATTRRNGLTARDQRRVDAHLEELCEVQPAVAGGGRGRLPARDGPPPSALRCDGGRIPARGFFGSGLRDGRWAAAAPALPPRSAWRGPRHGHGAVAAVATPAVAAGAGSRRRRHPSSALSPSHSSSPAGSRWASVAMPAPAPQQSTSAQPYSARRMRRRAGSDRRARAQPDAAAGRHGGAAGRTSAVLSPVADLGAASTLRRQPLGSTCRRASSAGVAAPWATRRMRPAAWFRAVTARSRPVVASAATAEPALHTLRRTGTRHELRSSTSAALEHPGDHGQSAQVTHAGRRSSALIGVIIPIAGCLFLRGGHTPGERGQSAGNEKSPANLRVRFTGDFL